MTRLEKVLANEKRALETCREMQTDYAESIARNQDYLDHERAQERELLDSIARLETLVSA